MKTIQVNLSALEELDEKPKEKALQEYAYFNVEDDWWQFIYEDAAMVGIKITGFDIDRGAYCKGEFITDAKSSADLILANHGENTATYQTAKAFNAEHENLFLSGILNNYLAILRYEYNYLTSEKAVIETIEANEYLFTIDGKPANRLEKLDINI
jgi:hypothetical protein